MLGVSQSIVNHLKAHCKDLKADLDKAFRHSELGELFTVERQLNDQCTRQIGSAIEHFASLIDVYVTWINTAGNMLLIERAHLAKDIDFLQSEKISDQQKVDTTRNLIDDMFRTGRLSLNEIERRCRFFPDELKKWSAECEALSKQADDLGADLFHSRLAPDISNLSPIWDDAIQPLIARHQASQEAQRENIVSLLTRKYDDALSDFEAHRTAVVAAWKRRIKIVGWIGAAAITLRSLRFTDCLRFQSVKTEALLIGAGGNALWAFLCRPHKKRRRTTRNWIIRSEQYSF